MKGRELNPQFNVLNVLERGVSFDKRKFWDFQLAMESHQSNIMERLCMHYTTP
jgi:hypothetical protein